jgi:hypothetical protein
MDFGFSAEVLAGLCFKGSARVEVVLKRVVHVPNAPKKNGRSNDNLQERKPATCLQSFTTF